MIGIGSSTRLQAFLESTSAWGTRVITTGSAIEPDDINVDIDQGFIESKALYGGLSARALYQMGIKYTGRASGEFRYESLMKVLAAVMGTTPTTSGSAGAGYTHVYTVGKTSQGGLQSLCFELDEGGVYKSSGDCSLVSGVVIPRARFHVAAGQGDDAILRWETDLIAKDKVPQTTAQFTGGVTAALVQPVLYHTGVSAQLKDGTTVTAGSQNVTNIGVEISSPLADSRYVIAGPNGKNILQPLRNGRVMVEWSLEQEFQTWDQHDAAKAFTSGELKLQFDSGIVIPGASSNYLLTLNTTLAKCVAFSSRVGEWGIIKATSRWRAFHDPAGSPTNGPLILTLVNGKSGCAVLGA